MTLASKARVLMVARADHHSVEFPVREDLNFHSSMPESFVPTPYLTDLYAVVRSKIFE